MGNLVIVSGGSSGLGLSILESVPFEARRFDISRSGPPENMGIEHIGADLSEPLEWPRVVTALEELIDSENPERAAFIHAAGTLSPIGFAGEVEPEEYAANVLLNSAAGQVLGQHFLAAVAHRPGNHDVIMITSGAASKAYPGWSAYGAGKAALDQWVRTVGAEQNSRGGVRVVAIAPGVLDTPMQAMIRETSSFDFPDVDRFRQLDAEGRLTRPEIAARMLWRTLEGLETGDIVDLRDYER